MIVGLLLLVCYWSLHSNCILSNLYMFYFGKDSREFFAGSLFVSLFYNINYFKHEKNTENEIVNTHIPTHLSFFLIFYIQNLKSTRTENWNNMDKLEAFLYSIPFFYSQCYLLLWFIFPFICMLLLYYYMAIDKSFVFCICQMFFNFHKTLLFYKLIFVLNI